MILTILTTISMFGALFSLGIEKKVSKFNLTFLTPLFLISMAFTIVHGTTASNRFETIEKYDKYAYLIDRQATQACINCKYDSTHISDKFGPCTATLLYARRLNIYNDALYFYKKRKENIFISWLYHEDISRFKYLKMELNENRSRSCADN